MTPTTLKSAADRDADFRLRWGWLPRDHPAAADLFASMKREVRRRAFPLCRMGLSARWVRLELQKDLKVEIGERDRAGEPMPEWEASLRQQAIDEVVPMATIS